jgi:hypothetical protein
VARSQTPCGVKLLVVWSRPFGGSWGDSEGASGSENDVQKRRRMLAACAVSLLTKPSRLADCAGRKTSQ